MSKTTTGSGNDEPVTSLGVGLLDSLVDGDTSAQDGSSIVQREIIWNLGQLGSVGDSVLLEGSIDRVARALRRLAERFVALSAELAFIAGVGNPGGDLSAHQESQALD